MTALRIDVADLLAHPSARREVALSVPVAGLVGTAARVGGDEPVVLELVLERIPDGIVVRGTLTTRWESECSVCLRELEHPMTLSIGEMFEPEPLEGDTYPIDGHEIDLEQLVRDTVVLELPLAPVCADLDGSPCAEAVVPTDTAPPPDPRWAALSELEL
jgi:uncharacterized protein